MHITGDNIVTSLVEESSGPWVWKHVRTFLLRTPNYVPVIEAVHRVSTDKEIGIIFPLRRYNNSLEKAADFAITMREKMLSRCQFPDKVKTGSTTIEKPDSWR